MSEENNTRSLEEITGDLAGIAGLSQVLNNFDAASKSPSNYANLLDGATTILSGSEPGSHEYNDILAELEGDKGSAYLKLNASRGQRIGEIKNDYEASKDEIIETIVAKLNDSLKGVKDKVEAIKKVSYAFGNLISENEMSQEEADEITKGRLRSIAKLPIMTSNPRGNPKGFKDLEYRNFVDSYISEKKDEKGNVSYGINEEALGKLVDNPVAGAILYLSEEKKEGNNE